MLYPSPTAHELKYRKDIDGLRAVAVLPVVIFHLGLPIHGGFVGVDVFFVISGYLIGAIILSEMARGEFSFARFYERRIRRIFPALFATLIASAIVAWRYLLPHELESFAQSLVAAVSSLSNFFFWSQASYFDDPNSKPLLHTWSLSVEEQFYIFFPLLMFFIRHWAQKRIELTLYLALVVSFAISVYGAFAYPTATFYAPWTRAWELLLGVVLTFDSFPTLRRPALRHVAGCVGLAMIGAACLLFKESMPFPGLAALLPCVGAGLVILAGKSGPHLAGRVLSLKPVVFIGLISYSFYLWHWPLIVFEQHGLTLVQGLTKHQEQAVTFVAAFVLAVLSWRFIEQPFRSGKWRPASKPLFIGAGVAAAASVAWGVAATMTGGLPDRFPAQAQAVAKWVDPDAFDKVDQFRNHVCFMTSRSSTLADYKRETCLPQRPGQPRVLLIGDSHAAAMWWGLDHVLKGSNVMQATASGCKPVLEQRPRQFRHCVDVMNFALRDYLAANPVDLVLIQGRWNAGDVESVGQTVTWLRERKVPVLLVGPNPEYDSPLPRLLAYSIAWEDPQLPARHRVPSLRALDEQMAGLARDTWKVPYISLFDLTCRDEVCDEYAQDGVPMLSDYGHFTKAGSIYIARKIAGLGVLPAIIQSRLDDSATDPLADEVPR